MLLNGKIHLKPNLKSRTGGQPAKCEAGYILLGVLILLALFVIALAVAAPLVAKDIERDKEVEAVQHGKQYTRAIKLYYKRFGAYPTSIKQLETTNNVRFLRKHYIDPITGKDDWRLIHVGEAKVPVMGLFGQPLASGQSSTINGLMGNGSGGFTTGGGSAPGSANGGGVATAPAGQLPGMSASTGASGGTPGNPAGSNGSATPGTDTGGLSSGGPIVGVGIPVNKKSIIVYHKQDAFNKWEFTYDPSQDMATVSSSNGAIAGASGIGTNPTSPATNPNFNTPGTSPNPAIPVQPTPLNPAPQQ